MPATLDTLLDVRGMKMYFPVTKGTLLKKKVGDIKAVDGVSFKVGKGETLGLVGESGCGKTTTGRCILQLNRPTAGEVLFEGNDLCKLSRAELRPVRRRLQLCYQDPYGSLDPRMKVGSTVGEPLVVHGLAKGRAYQQRVAELFETVGLNPYSRNRYPHEFSGGQRQRIGIARALAAGPDFIVCDEPVSALDVSIQAQIINLLMKLQEKMGLAYLFIAHDLAVVRHVSHRIAVMYLGCIVETADRVEIYENPLHPYTRALLSAVPTPDPDAEAGRHRILLKGDIPSPAKAPSGCHFRTRCAEAMPRCAEEAPVLRDKGNRHEVACLRV